MAVHREIETEETVVIVRVEVKGNLHVRGSKGGTVCAESRDNAPHRTEKIHGDLRVTQAAGVNAEKIYGPAHINDVSGAVSVNSKGGAHLHGAVGSASVNCLGNAHLSDINGEQVRAVAKSDIQVHFAIEWQMAERRRR